MMGRWMTDWMSGWPDGWIEMDDGRGGQVDGLMDGKCHLNDFELDDA